jgi:hypothetical protein
MAGPGDERAAAHGQGGGGIRASHADRERVIDALKDAFVHGRLTKDELDSRAGQAFTARTYAELAVLTADLPAGPPGTESAPKPARARPPVSAEVKAGGRAIAAIYLTAGVLFLAAAFAGDSAVGGAFFFLGFMVGVVSVFFTLYGAVVLLRSLSGRRSAGQLPPEAA